MIFSDTLWIINWSRDEILDSWNSAPQFELNESFSVAKTKIFFCNTKVTIFLVILVEKFLFGGMDSFHVWDKPRNFFFLPCVWAFSLNGYQ